MEEKKAVFNWFPGHMNKSIKDIERQISVVDLVVYIIDARAPLSTQNFLFKNILKSKKIIYLFAKSDISDMLVTNKWLDYFNMNFKIAMLIEKNCNKNKSNLIKFINHNLTEVFKKQRSRGYEKINSNVLVIGIPNVGKSTFINSLSTQKKVNAANKPGVTRGLQRIVLTPEITLIDSPGISPSKFETKEKAIICAASNCLRIFDTYKNEVAASILDLLLKDYKCIIEDAFKIKLNNYYEYNEEYIYNIFEELSILYSGEKNNIDLGVEIFLNKLLNYKITNISFERPKNE
ncbi:ribosome biogenesis GTPase YlqF [Spiroplasma endosymbiont of Aspidapion aeneum]|uniref:ribosome biogenesis GTPase YlqF n=1 Tax=Spiroplasma endosymbiont of Aspidapion aeneum TaxID=3066276 RepID=UPI00313CB15F